MHLFDTVPRLLGRIFWGEPRLDRRELLLTAYAFGIVAGLLEAGAHLSLFLLNNDPRFAPHPDNVWLTPIALAATAVIAAFLLMLILWRWRAGFSLATAVMIGTTVTVYTVLVTLRMGIQHGAILLLAAGTGVAVARFVARNPAAFTRRLRTVAVAVTLLPIAAAALPVSARLSRGSAPPAAGAAQGTKNLLVLILDTVRAKSLSLYGYARETTPELDRWAASGIVFDHAFSTAPWTLPSHASLFTGEWPHNLSADFGRPLDESQPTLAEALRDRGYATGGFVANLTFASRFTGLARGFTTYVDYTLDADAFLTSSRWTLKIARTIRRALGNHTQFQRKSAEEVNEEFIDWASGLNGKPFFAFLNYLDAHTPYETRPEFERRFSNKPLRYWQYDHTRGNYSPEELQEFLDAYESCIAYLDRQVGALLDELDRRGILRNTVVIIASDHGEQFGEHGLLEHSNSLYLPVLHVPLVILGADETRGIRVTEPVSLRDIPNTALDLLGMTATERFPGASLARFWKADADSTSDELILSEVTHNVSAAAIGPVREGDMKGSFHGSYHYILGAGTEELYDYILDPDESRNLAGQKALLSILNGFRQQMHQIQNPRY